MLLFEAAKLRGELSVQRGELTRWQWWLWTWWSWWSWWSWWTWWLWLLWTWWSWWSWWTWWLQLRQYVCDVLTILPLLDCIILSLNYFVLKPANCSPMHWWSRSDSWYLYLSAPPVTVVDEFYQKLSQVTFGNHSNIFEIWFGTFSAWFWQKDEKVWLV